MLNTSESTTNQTSDDRESRIRALLVRLQPDADRLLRRMAEGLVDLPDDQLFGAIEYQLRDLGHDLAACAHQAHLEVGKKGAT